ncbi:zinc finger protein 343 isoform X3 [Globicephala melas]|uniref:zinc finger protein 343 isoform X3 n=1 Tax=Globicephala melas TaxID=9731 RepID=UPI0038736CF9
MKSFLPGLLAEFQGEHGADSGAMMLPDPSAWREQDWEEMLPLENREVAETVKTPTQNHKAKGLPSHKTDWLQEKEGKVQNTGRATGTSSCIPSQQEAEPGCVR